MMPIIADNNPVYGAYRQDSFDMAGQQAHRNDLTRNIDHVTISVDDLPIDQRVPVHITSEQTVVSNLRQRDHAAPSDPPVNTGINAGQSFIPAQLASCPDTVIDIPDANTVVDTFSARPASPSPSEISNTGCRLLAMPPDKSAETVSNSTSAMAQVPRHAKNLALTVTRNVISVTAPTATREYVRRGVLPTVFANAPKYVAPCAGALALGVPVALQLAGLVNDYLAGTQTTASVVSRLSLIGFNVASGAALVASGGFSAAIEALVAAVFIYVPTRDALQFLVKLTDNNPGGVLFTPTALSAGCYAVNQTIVDKCMDLSSQMLGPYMSSLSANIIGRSFVNVAGETVDELVYRGVNAWAKNNEQLELKLDFFARKELTWDKFRDACLNTLSSRSSLFASAFAFGFSNIAETIPGCFKAGASLGVGYTPFVYAHAQKTKEQPSIEDIEMGQLPAN